MAKMRVSQHSGRQGSAKHNDRSFLSDKSDQERREMAPHISAEAGTQNVFWSWQKGVDFETAERNFYKARYSASVEATNERYRKEGHADRCKTTDDLHQGKLTRPEETILQIGDMKDDISRNEFLDCFTDYMKRLEEWNQEHGSHMHILSMAVHMDEASPHAHVRRVWDYTDKDGLVRLGQNKGLEQAGVPLPEPDKPNGRFNNRKMTFDAMARGLWQEVCKAHGFEIETEARPNARHKDKVEYINDKLSEALKTIERADGIESRVEALESRSRILKASQVKDSQDRAKSSFLNKNKVVLPRADYEALLSTAKAAEEAQKQTAKLVKEHKRAQATAQRIIEDAKKEASSITEEALSEKMQRRAEVDMYKKLEAAFPDVFKRMRDTLKEQKRSRSQEQNHGHGRF